jgi:DNA-binding response OmpR family regulator
MGRRVGAVSKSRILVVDDDARLVHIVAMYLGIEGYEVATAENGEEGLAEIARQPPDLVILDIMMPGMDGIEVCKRVRSDPETRSLPVLMFSALSSDEDIERARLAGANHLIKKPFSLVGLGSVVKTFFPNSGEDGEEVDEEPGASS